MERSTRRFGRRSEVLIYGTPFSTAAGTGTLDFANPFAGMRGFLRRSDPVLPAHKLNDALEPRVAAREKLFVTNNVRVK